MLGAIVDVSDAGGTASGENVALESDYWTPLAHRNASALTLVSGVQATAATGVEGSDNAITWTAVEYGTDGNAITVALVDPGATAALSVSVTGTAITVNLAYSGAITSTATEVMAAIEASAAASALVTVADTGESEGSGVVAAVTATNLSAGANTGGTSFTLDTHYELDDKLGLLRPIAGTTLAALPNAFASYTYSSVTGTRIEVSTDYTVRCRLLLRGTNDADDSAIEWEAYQALVTPNGEFDLMASEPVQAQFSLEFETPDTEDHPIRMEFPTYA
jgi:hypothetical protein